MDSISTYYGLGYLFSIILWTKTVLVIIRVIHGRKFGYLVLYLLLSESFTAGDVITSYCTCYYQSHSRPEIWLPRIVLTIIRVIHSPKCGYLVLYLPSYRLSRRSDLGCHLELWTIQKVSFNIR